MAAFEVPIATGLFTGIPHDIATAPGAMLPGQAIGNLADAYWSGQNQAYQQRLRDLFKEGAPTNLGDLATQYIQAKGAEGVPEFVSLGNLGLLQGLANRPTTTPNVPVPGQSGYGTPETGTPAGPAAANESPTAGTATGRQIAQARGVPLEQFMAQNGITNPDIPLTYEQRKALVYGTPATGEEPVRVAGADATTTVPSAAQTIANRFPNPVPPLGTPFPPSVGAPNGAQPTAGRPQQPAQAAPARPIAQAAPPLAPQGTAPQVSPQALSDVQVRQLENTAANEIKDAQVLRERAAVAASTGQPAGAALAKTWNEEAAAKETRANDIYQNLLKRSTPTTEQQNAAASGMNPLQYEGAKGEQAKLTDHLAKLADAGIDASGKLRQLNDVQRLGEKVGYGAVPKIQSMLGRYGIDTTGLSDIQAYERAIDFMAPQLRPAGSGRLMEKELTAFRNSLGGLMTTPQGRRISIENLKLIQEFTGEVGRIAADTRLSPQERYKEIYALPEPKLQTKVTSPGSGASGGGWQQIAPGVRIREKP